MANNLHPLNIKLIISRPYLVYVFIVPFASFWLLYIGTKWGVGTSPDSIQYISSAISILNSRSLDSLGANFPPLYSIFISIGGLIHENVYESARFQQIFLYSANILMVGFIIFSVTKKNTCSFLGMLLFSTSPFIYALHAYALSEGLFFLFLFSGLYVLNIALNQNNARLIATAAVLISLSSLTRYAGMSAIASCILFVLLSKQKKQWVFLIATSSIPLLLWVIRNKLVSGGAVNRAFEYHPISIDGLFIALNTVSDWLHLPGEGAAPPTLILALTATLIYYINKNDLYKEHVNIASFHKLLTLFCSIYIVLICASISFFDALTPLDFRILSPIFIGGILYISTCIALLDGKGRHQAIIRNIIISPLIILIAAQTLSLKDYVNEYHTNGIGFSSKKWATSDIIKILSTGKYQRTIYTNAPEPISIYTGLPTTMVPSVILPTKSIKNPEFDHEIEIMEKAILSKKGIYIHFHDIRWRWYLPSLESIIQNMGMTPEYSGEDGVILVYDSS